MIAFDAHFDGNVIVPESAVDLPKDRPLIVRVETFESGRSVLPETNALQWLAENAVEDDLPADLAAQQDHYRFGLPRRS